MQLELHSALECFRALWTSIILALYLPISVIITFILDKIAIVALWIMSVIYKFSLSVAFLTTFTFNLFLVVWIA